jgi:RimJ/RimL family protein N-acetyltransferase
MPSVPPAELLGPTVTLRRYRPTDRDAIREAIATSYEQLHEWMPWAQTPPTDESVRGFLDLAVERFGGDASADYAITLPTNGRYVGGCSLIPRIGPGAIEIGYWVDVRFGGRGIATEAAGLLTAAGLDLDGVDRVEIHCDEANTRSAAIPPRLGYQLDRIERDEIATPGHTGRSMIWIATPPWSPPPREPDVQPVR